LLTTSGASEHAMSRANRIGKELARQRAALMRAEQERREARNRRTAVYGSSLGVVLLAIVLGIVVTGAVQPSTPPLAPGKAVADTTGGISNADGMAIPVGLTSAPVKLTVYEDPRCSGCAGFEKQDESAYKPLVQAGKVELLVHLVDLIDNNRGGSGSLAAGNAMACAQNAGKFEDYHDVLYANQPSESTDSFSSTATLIGYAKQVSGLDSPAFEACVKAGTYDDWVRQNYRDLEQIDGIANIATPTVFVNGAKLDVTTLTAQQFSARLEQLAAAAAPSPSASAKASGSAKASAGASAAASGTATPSASSTATPASASASPSPSRT
jgi:protein-disulfide isomerase